MNADRQHPSIVSITRMWRTIGGAGLERFQLLQEPEGWILRGTIVRFHDGQPMEARYSIECDSRWRTANANIEIRADDREAKLLVENQDGRWIANGEHAGQLDGCMDIDLEWSPSTNALPIRRLNMADRTDGVPVNAAWVRFPDLVLESLPQQYQRLADHMYRYSSHKGEFTADLVVDQNGIVEEYKGYWKQVLK